MTVSETLDIIIRLTNSQKKGSQYVGSCPLCENSDPNGHHFYTSIKNGNIVMHCHKCKAPFDQYCNMLGIKQSDCFENNTTLQSPSAVTSEKREHIYHDIDGKIIAKKVISKKQDGKKDCKWYRYENGSFIMYLNGLKPPIYDVHKIDKTDTIYIAEGEKDVETLQKMGYTATTSPTGAGSNWNTDNNKYIKGKNIIIIRDNDDAGIKYANDIAQSIVDDVCSVKIIDPTRILPNLKNKGDISDIVDTIGLDETNNTLKITVATTKNYRKKDIFDELGLYNYSDLNDSDKEPPQFIVDGMIPNGLTFLSGAPKIRKSFLALQLAEAVASGKKFLGLNTHKCGVVYFDLEGSRSRLSDRATKMNIELPDNLFISNNLGVKLSGDLVEKLKQLHREKPELKLFIIDTYSRARGQFKAGGANAYDADVQLLEPIQKMALQEKISVVFIHHDKKGANFAQDSFERLSGTMGISGSADSVINLIIDGKRFDGKATLEYNPRDAKGGEMNLKFNDNLCLWQQTTDTDIEMENIPLIKWIIDNRPTDFTLQKIIPYDELYKNCNGTTIENAGTSITNTLKQYYTELFIKYNIGIQTGVKTGGKRGIRIVKCKTN